MDFALSEQQEMLKNTARDFFTKELPKSLVKEMTKDERGYLPELWRKMAAAGFMGVGLPEKYSGSGRGFLDIVLLLQEMGRACVPGRWRLAPGARRPERCSGPGRPGGGAGIAGYCASGRGFLADTGATAHDARGVSDRSGLGRRGA